MRLNFIAEFASVGWELGDESADLVAPRLSLRVRWSACLSALSPDWDWHVACFEWVGVALLLFCVGDR